VPKQLVGAVDEMNLQSVPTVFTARVTNWNQPTEIPLQKVSIARPFMNHWRGELTPADRDFLLVTVSHLPMHISQMQGDRTFIAI
jgi:hypothetical protein